MYELMPPYHDEQNFMRIKHRFISNFDIMIHVVILIETFGQESTMVFK